MTIQVQIGKTYRTRSGNVVTTVANSTGSLVYPIRAVDQAGYSYSVTAEGYEYDGEIRRSDLVEEIKTGGSQVDVENLNKLKQESDQANSKYLEMLSRLQASLPEGIKLIVDGEEFDGQVEGATATSNVRLIEITDKNSVVRGMTLRLVDDFQTDTTRKLQKRNNLTLGRDYNVSFIDSFSDPQIIGNDGSIIDTRNILSNFRIVVQEGIDSRNKRFVGLTLENRDLIQVGTRLKATRNHGFSSLTAGNIYTVISKPDNDGRFVGDDGGVRDTVWFYDGELEIEVLQ